MLADVSGATGAKINEVALAYGQVQAKGKLQTEELYQLQERGIGIADELKRMYGLTGEEFVKALEKGQIGAEAVEQAFINLTGTSGKYFNGATAQSETLAGKWSTLIDAVTRLAQNLGQTLGPALKGILTDFGNQYHQCHCRHDPKDQCSCWGLVLKTQSTNSNVILHH